MSTFPTAMVVEPRPDDAKFLADALRSGGYDVTVASFAEAKAVLNSSPPQLLVVDICQGAFNGLHLVVRLRSARATVAAVVTCPYDDSVLRRDAESLGAVFAVKPTTREELLAAAARVLWRNRHDSDPIRQPFERRHTDRRLAAGPIPGPDRRRMERRRLPTAVAW